MTWFILWHWSAKLPDTFCVFQLLGVFLLSSLKGCAKWFKNCLPLSRSQALSLLSVEQDRLCVVSDLALSGLLVLELILQIILRVLHALAPSYISNLLTPFKPDSTLRSLGRALLSDPQAWLKTKGDPCEPMCCVWNNLYKQLKLEITIHLVFSKACSYEIDYLFSLSESYPLHFTGRLYLSQLTYYEKNPNSNPFISFVKLVQHLFNMCLLGTGRLLGSFLKTRSPKQLHSRHWASLGHEQYTCHDIVVSASRAGVYVSFANG